MRHHQLLHLLACFMLGSLPLCAAEPTPPLPSAATLSPSAIGSPLIPGSLFRNGDRWVAVGDSITHGGFYPRYLELYQVTRFPATRVSYSNAGISGDSAGGVMLRADWDVLSTSPTVATIMLGMNDVSRGAYAPIDTHDHDQQREQAIKNYAFSLGELIEKLQAHHVRVVMISTTPCDDTAVLNAKLLPGVDDGLARTVLVAREVAARHGCEFVDLHTPMRVLNRHAQATDPTRTLSGGDRIHPDAVGNLVMASLILQATHAPREVAVVHVEQGKLRTALNCTVSDLQASSTRVAFTYLSNSLPFPLPDYAASVTDWIPFHEMLNREELRIGGLDPGTYTVQIDDQAIGEFDAAALGRGINLALLATPQQAQAREVHDLLAPRWSIIQDRLRTIAAIEYWFARDEPRPLTMETMEPLLAKWEKTLDSNHWQRGWPAIYRHDKPRTAEIAAELERTLEQARAAAQPRPHAIRVEPVTAK